MNPTTIHDLPAAWRADPHANAEGCARQLEEMLADSLDPLHLLQALCDRKDAKIASLTAERDELQAMLSKEQRWRIEADERPQAELDKLRLDVAELTGRLRERTDAMLERQVELRDEARRMRSVADEAVTLLEKLAWKFQENAEDRSISRQERERWAEDARRLREWIQPMRSRLDASPPPNAAKCGQCADTPGGASIINDG